jgi:hypothetical protein
MMSGVASLPAGATISARMRASIKISLLPAWGKSTWEHRVSPHGERVSSLERR